MKQKHAHFALTVAFVVLMTGCASSPKQDLANLPPPKDSHEAAQRIQIEAQVTPQGEASPVVLSKNGHEVMYIKRTYPGSEGMTPQQIELSKQFGTYDDLQESVAVDQGSVWVGTVVTLADGKCTESTSSIAEIPKVPGEPKMNVVNKLIPCPAVQAN
ncbi:MULTISPECIES: hypothetical protein [Pseudomonas]|uniref:hypothetical protein n=1 Tax=Pseudomonas TaxID=286 RepID=UPI00070D940A|nr:MULTISPECIES: hypothetical protein [Pseudomonas]KQW19907.1 hypothetical protein ASC85_08645 [Pseudomonas sp. Root401]WHS57492.1 hypothetical protein QLH64_31220 [Pseudomonas brassicacearum]